MVSAADNSVPGPQGTSLCLLLVDTDPAYRGALEREIGAAAADLRLVMVDDEGTLAGVLDSMEFDGAIFETALPWSDGLGILHALRRASPDCPAIIYAARPDLALAVEAMKLGVDDYIVKDAGSVGRLAAAVRTAVGRRRQRGRSRRADSRLREAEAKYRALVEQLPAVTFSITADGSRALYVSPQVEALLGIAPQEWLEAPTLWRQCVPAEDQARVAAELKEAFASGLPFHREYRLQARGGRLVWVSIDAVVVRDELDNPVCVQGVAVDISGERWMLDALAESNRRLQALSRRLVDVQETERRTVAAELHDRVGQSLSALSINLNLIGQRLPEASAELEARLEDSRQLVEGMAETIRDVIAELRPAVLDDYGLLAAVRWYGQQFEKRTGIGLTVSGSERRLPAPLEAALFRIVQEALTNVAKHAQASRVGITLQVMRGGGSLTVIDNGRGFDARPEADAAQRGGWGLSIIRERVESVGGRLKIDSSPGGGSRITVLWQGRP